MPVGWNCRHAGPWRVASRTPDHFLGGTGALKRRFFTGGCANGTPRNRSAPPALTPLSRPSAVFTTGLALALLVLAVAATGAATETPPTSPNPMSAATDVRNPLPRSRALMLRLLQADGGVRPG